MEILYIIFWPLLVSDLEALSHIVGVLIFFFVFVIPISGIVFGLSLIFSKKKIIKRYYAWLFAASGLILTGLSFYCSLKGPFPFSNPVLLLLYLPVGPVLVGLSLKYKLNGKKSQSYQYVFVWTGIVLTYFLTAPWLVLLLSQLTNQTSNT